VFNLHESKDFCDWLIIVYDVDKSQSMYQHMIHQANASLHEGMARQLMEQQLELLYSVNSTSLKPLSIVDIIIANKNNKQRVFHELFTTYCDRHFEEYILPQERHSHGNLPKKEYQSPLSHSVYNPCRSLHDSNINTTMFNQHLISKGSLFTLLLPYLPHYEYIWVLDGDMSFEGMNLTTFKAIHQCAFEYPPYISQALINIPSQFYRYLIKRHWEQKGDTLASTVGFIEIQAPFLHARFFEWYIMSFIIPLLPAMHILGADWGLDELFCTAAQEYMRTPPLHHEVNGNTPACAVITANMSLHHEDSADIRKSVGGEVKRELNFGLMKIVHRYFNSFAFHGLQYHVNPLNRGTNFYMINKLRQHCSAQL
jgi:hypothetical protein